MEKIKIRIHPIVAQIIAIIIIIIVAIGIYSPFNKAIEAIKQQDYTKAIKITSIGAKIFPYSKWYSIRGYAKFQTQDYEGAIADFNRAYNLETDDYKIIDFDNKIYVKYYLKDYNGALNDFDYEIEHSKDDFVKDSFIWDKAQFLYNIGKYKDALNIYNTLLIKSDEDKIYLLKNRLYFERAQVYKKLEQYNLAQKDLEMAKNSQEEDFFENPIPAPALLLDNEI